MNAPFNPAHFSEVNGQATVGVSVLKANPAAVISVAQERAVAVLSRNRTVAYVISPQVWEFLNEVLADRDAEEMALDALERGEAGIEVDLDDYLQG